jgi:hypothetical protein
MIRNINLISSFYVEKSNLEPMTSANDDELQRFRNRESIAIEPK